MKRFTDPTDITRKRENYEQLMPMNSTSYMKFTNYLQDKNYQN